MLTPQIISYLPTQDVRSSNHYLVTAAGYRLPAAIPFKEDFIDKR